MPIYEYRCTDCHRKFEQIVLRGKALDDTSCPRCGSRMVERLVSSFSLSGVRRKSEDDFGDDIDAPDTGLEGDFGNDDLGNEEDLGYDDSDNLEDEELDRGFDEDLEEDERP
jgi:putative FmdB family regulatory protein